MADGSSGNNDDGRHDADEHGGGRDRLAFVRPERRKLVQARIDVLNRFLAKSPRTRDDAGEAAGELGLAVSSFYRLVAVWKDRKEPNDLVGAGARVPSGTRRGLDDEQFIERVLAELPPGGSIEQDALKVEAAAAAAGRRLRSRKALLRLVSSKRKPNRDPHDAALVIDFAAVEIPVLAGERTIMPIAAILFGRSPVPLAAQLSTAPARPQAVASLIAHALTSGALTARSGLGDSYRGIACDARLGTALGLARLLPLHGIDYVPGVPGESHIGRFAMRQLGGRLLGGALHPRLAIKEDWLRPFPRESALNVPLSLAEAQQHMDEGLGGAARGAGALAIDATAVAALAVEMDRLARTPPS